MPSRRNRECDFKLAKEAGLALHRWPESEAEAKRAEEFLANELANLSLVEHECILFDIYGIAAQEKEDSEMIDSGLNDLQSELDRIESKDDYNLALQMNPTYVESRSFRLPFLRCEQFDANAAAKRMVAHFVEKRNLFGSGEVLGRDVAQSDLGETDMAILRSGYIQVLPIRDASGRLIQFMTPMPQDLVLVDDDPLSECRAAWYQSMSLLRDGDSYKRGAVYVIMKFDFRTMPVDLFTTMARVENALPTMVVGGHYCYSNPDLTPSVHGFHIMMPEHDRHRMRVHFGDSDELDFKLQTHGIPTEAFPYNQDGSLSTEKHLAWLETLRKQEERVSKVCKIPSGQESHQLGCPEEGIIYIPGRFDVLFGKSALARDHTGTRRALHVVEMYCDDYERATEKSEKTEIAERIIAGKCCVGLQRLWTGLNFLPSTKMIMPSLVVVNSDS